MFNRCIFFPYSDGAQHGTRTNNLYSEPLTLSITYRNEYDGALKLQL